MWTNNQIQFIDKFSKELTELQWFREVGTKSDRYTVVHLIFEAWDRWNEQMLEVWGKASHELEQYAMTILSNNQIDYIFELISKLIAADLYNELCNFEEKPNLEDESGLENEITDFIIRDTAWACIESLIDKKDFFTKVYEINKSGRWACSWDGKYPYGKFVVM